MPNVMIRLDNFLIFTGSHLVTASVVCVVFFQIEDISLNVEKNGSGVHS